MKHGIKTSCFPAADSGFSATPKGSRNWLHNELRAPEIGSYSLSFRRVGCECVRLPYGCGLFAKQRFLYGSCFTRFRNEGNAILRVPVASAEELLAFQVALPDTCHFRSTTAHDVLVPSLACLSVNNLRRSSCPRCTTGFASLYAMAAIAEELTTSPYVFRRLTSVHS